MKCGPEIRKLYTMVSEEAIMSLQRVSVSSLEFEQLEEFLALQTGAPYMEKALKELGLNNINIKDHWKIFYILAGLMKTFSEGKDISLLAVQMTKVLLEETKGANNGPVAAS